jgi:WD40 repeat protein
LVFGGPWGMKLWDVNTKKEIQLNGEPGHIQCCAFSPDGELLLSAGDDVVCLWDMKKLNVINTLKQSYVINRLALSGDGKWLAVGLDNNKIKIWNMPSLKEVATITEESPLASIAINNNGSLLATVGYYNTNLWDVANQNKVNSLSQQGISIICFSSDNKYLASGSVGEVVLWDMNPYADIFNNQVVEPNGKLAFSWGGIKNGLGQNYPNPFNPETWIPYQLADDSEATIGIYNAEGQLIRKLDLSNKKAGNYKAHWDGKDERGQAVASGVYFYILKTGNFSDIKKMVILR